MKGIGGLIVVVCAVFVTMLAGCRTALPVEKVNEDASAPLADCCDTPIAEKEENPSAVRPNEYTSSSVRSLSLCEPAEWKVYEEGCKPYGLCYEPRDGSNEVGKTDTSDAVDRKFRLALDSGFPPGYEVRSIRTTSVDGEAMDVEPRFTHTHGRFLPRITRFYTLEWPTKPDPEADVVVVIEYNDAPDEEVVLKATGQ